MISIPLIDVSEYAMLTIANQISINLLLWAHIAPAVFGLIFSFFLYRYTKKLSALYLFLVAVFFAIWAYFSLVSWFGYGHQIMFTWSLLDVLGMAFSTLTVWFLYTFVNGKDVPLLGKIVPVILYIPVFAYTILSLNINSFYAPEAIANEANLVLFYLFVVQIAYLIMLVYIGVKGYVSSTDKTQKSKALYGTIATFLFLTFMISFSLVVSMILYLDLGDYTIYNSTVYGLFGMPFMMAFIGYLIAKYQAFDLKLTKSIGMIVLLMGLLFLSIFV